jgi:hypothetical protein
MALLIAHTPDRRWCGPVDLVDDVTDAARVRAGFPAQDDNLDKGWLMQVILGELEPIGDLLEVDPSDWRLARRTWRDAQDARRADAVAAQLAALDDGTLAAVLAHPVAARKAEC